MLEASLSGFTKPNIMNFILSNMKSKKITWPLVCMNHELTWVWHQLNVIALEDQLILLARWQSTVHT